MKNLTYQVFERYPAFPDKRWVAQVSDAATGKVESINYFDSETAGRDWAEGYINGVPNTHGGWSLHIGAVENLGTIDLDKVFYGDFQDDYSPPPRVEKPTIECTCYCCGAKFTPMHVWHSWTDELELEMKHCTKVERRKFTLTEAQALAKVGYMAFISF